MNMKFKKKIVSFILSFLLIASGVYYFGLSYVPRELYETRTMSPHMPESYYVNQCAALSLVVRSLFYGI